jgi:DNA-binding transcriptional LysR family regulator
MLGDFILGTDLIATMPRALAETVYHGLAHCAPPLDLPRVEYHLVWHRRYDHSGRNQWLRELVMNARSSSAEGGAPS